MNTQSWPRIELERGALCVGDLHLDASSPSSGRPLEEFLAREARAPALVVLGDLFETWVGPAHAELAGARAVLATLARWSQAGRALHLVPGNRDFLLGEDFERACGARVHARGCIARLGAGSTLLIHGDELCTLDLGYQRLKRVLRSAPLLALAPRVPSSLALALARRLRARSVRAIAAKPSSQKEQQTDEVRRLALAAGADTLLCGHAHAYRDQALAGGPRWIVLDAFGGPRDVGEVADGGRWLVRGSAGPAA